jgi:nitroreductase
MAGPYDPVPLDFTEYPPDEMQTRARAFREQRAQRRSVRDFSDRSVPRELVEEALRTVGSAPSGAHRQPWQFVAVDDPNVKSEVRHAAEAEEKEFYKTRVTEEWKEALAPLGTGERGER